MNPRKLFVVFLSGLLLGAAVAAKPLMLFVFLAFILYFIFENSAWKNWIVVTIFSLGFVAAPIYTLFENYRVSDGKLLGLGANGGVNFFQAYCEAHRVQSQSASGSFWVLSPGVLDDAPKSAVTFEQPFYRQGYYYSKGIDCMRQDPQIWLKRLVAMKKLFGGVLGPGGPQTPPGHVYMLAIHQKILLGMTVALFFLYPVLFERLRYPNYLFMTSLLLLYLTSIYLMAVPERRYLYAVEFIIYLLFFCSLYFSIKKFHQYRRYFLLNALVAVPVILLLFFQK